MNSSQKFLANFVLEGHQAAAPDFPTTSLFPLRSQGDAAYLGRPMVADSLYSIKAGEAGL
jgi:hypothetical protein